MSKLLQSQQALYPVVTEHRSISAYEDRSELAMTAEPDCALHVALHGEINGLVIEPRMTQSGDGEAHHDLGPTDQGNGVQRIEVGAGNQRGHDANLAMPCGGGMVHCHFDFDI